jgi:AcrR family transcriptional regulator
MDVSAAIQPSRRARKKERTRRQIYEAAVAQFRAHGFEAVTVDAICEAADVARGTFFLHFPTKASLLFEYWAELSRALAAALEQRPPGAARALRWLTDELLAHWLAHAELHARMLHELMRHPEGMARAPEEGRALAELISDVVRRGQIRGEFRADVAPGLVATVFLASSLSFLTGALVALGGEVPHTPDAVRDQFLTLLLSGLVAEPDGGPGAREG